MKGAPEEPKQSKVAGVSVDEARTGWTPGTIVTVAASASPLEGGRASQGMTIPHQTSGAHQAPASPLRGKDSWALRKDLWDSARGVQCTVIKKHDGPSLTSLRSKEHVSEFELTSNYQGVETPG